MKLFQLARELGGPFDSEAPLYNHIPLLCDATGKALHKRQSPDNAYLFDRWAEQFRTADERRDALERIILTDDGEMSRANFVWIDPAGTPVHSVPFFESGQFCEAF